MSELLIIILLIVINGLLAMAEVALISVRKSQLNTEIKNGSKAARTALKLAGDPDKFLSVVQIGITLVGILTGIYSGSVLADRFSDFLAGLGVSLKIAHPLAQTIIVVLVTYFTLIIGELVPKRIGMAAAAPVAKIVARPMYLLSLIASPFVWLLARSTSLLFRLTGFSKNSEKVTEEEIRSMIDEGARDGEIQTIEQEILQRVFLLGDLKVCSLMKHRSELIILNLKSGKAKMAETIRLNRHDCYPVIDGDFDHLIGLVWLKDLIFEFNDPAFNLADKIKPSLCIPENMSIYAALDQMKQKYSTRALICDEFGSFMGIITLKEILGGLTGTIKENKTDYTLQKSKDEDAWIVDGQYPLYDLLHHFDSEHLYLKQRNINTIGGLILKELEHIPVCGETLQWHQFKFQILAMDHIRISQIRLEVSGEK